MEEETFIIEANNDVQASEVVLNKFKGHYIICDKVKYIKKPNSIKYF